MVVKEEVAEKGQNCVNNRINDTLNNLIEARYGSKQKFANALGVQRSYVSQIVHGHIEPTNDMKIKIIRKLGMQDSREVFP